MLRPLVRNQMLALTCSHTHHIVVSFVKSLFHEENLPIFMPQPHPFISQNPYPSLAHNKVGFYPRPVPPQQHSPPHPLHPQPP